MVDLSKQILVMGSIEKISLREERKRTGRYIAAGAAIFLSLLGLYQAVVRGTPEYAALFAPALIMFIYILWILYASKNQQKNEKDLEKQLAAQELSTYKIEEVVQQEPSEKVNNDKEPSYTIGRSYSIA